MGIGIVSPDSVYDAFGYLAEDTIHPIRSMTCRPSGDLFQHADAILGDEGLNAVGCFGHR